MITYAAAFTCRIIRALAAAPAILLFAALPSMLTAGGATPCEFDGRTGGIEVSNNSLYPVRVRLVHADTNTYYPHDKHYWEIGPGMTERLSVDKGYGYGSDWGIRIGSSKIRCVGSAGSWDSATSTFKISTESFNK